MHWEYWVIGAGVTLAVLLLDPLAVLVKYRMSDRPEFAIIDPTEAPLPAYLLTLWSEADRELSGLGFEPSPRVLIHGAVPDVALSAVFYWHPGERDMALACAVHHVAAGRVRLVMTYVEFAAELTDGSSVTLSNSPRVAFEPFGDECINLRFPRERSVVTLHRLFRAAAARHARAGRRARPDGVWWETSFRETIERYIARMTRRGLMCPTRDGRHRLTIKGALLGTWVNYQPIRWLLNRRLGRRERDLLRFAGG